jgi:DNA-binding MarR family transcriptional regulator
MGSRPRQIGRECLGARIRLLARLLTGIYDDALRPFGVRISQTSILVVVANEGPISASLVCRILDLDKSTLSRDLQQIQAEGWLEIVPTDDARTKHLQVTPCGLELLDRIYPAWHAAQKEAVATLGPIAAVAIGETVNARWAKLRAELTE